MVAGYIAGVPAGLVDTSLDGVTSLLRPPFHHLIVLKVSRHWRAMGSIGLLARDVPTILVLRHRPRDSEQAIAHAEQYGMGLSYLHNGGAVDLVPPPDEPDEPTQRGLTRTRLFEVVFRRWMIQTAGTPAKRSHALSCFEGG
jgi:hypothetical protein